MYQGPRNLTRVHLRSVLIRNRNFFDEIKTGDVWVAGHLQNSKTRKL